MDTCPQCHRILLSHTSARCNWCGASIEDEEYLAQADAARKEYFEHQAESDALTLARTRWIHPSDSVLGRPLCDGTNTAIPSITHSRPQRPWKKKPKPNAWPEAPPEEQPDLTRLETPREASQPAESNAGVEYVWQPGVTPADTHLNPQLTELETWHAARTGKPRKKPGKSR